MISTLLADLSGLYAVLGKMPVICHNQAIARPQGREGKCVVDSIDVDDGRPEDSGTIIVYGRPGCPGLRPVLNLLHKGGVPYDYVNIREDAAAAARLRALAGGNESVPTVVLPDGRVLVEPGTIGLRRALQEAGLVGEALTPAAAVQAGLSNRVYWALALIALALIIAVWLAG
jgi:glutaredoxin